MPRIYKKTRDRIGISHAHICALARGDRFFPRTFRDDDEMREAWADPAVRAAVAIEAQRYGGRAYSKLSWAAEHFGDGDDSELAEVSS